MSRKKKDQSVSKSTAAEAARGTRIANLHAQVRVRKRIEDGGERLAMNIRRTGHRSNCREPIGGMTEEALTLRLADALGTTSPEFIDQMLSNLLTYFEDANPTPNDRRTTREINAALAVLDGLKPENEVEAMLISQMIASSDAALRCMGMLSTIAGAETYGNIAVKLMRTFTAQAEALAKLRRKGEQVVRVVHVHPGGQAVVGDVHNHREGGGGPITKIEGQSDATGNSRSGTALPGPDPLGEALPVASRRGEEEVPHARRD